MSGLEGPCEVCGVVFRKSRSNTRTCAQRECKIESRRTRMRLRREVCKARDGCADARRLARPLLVEPASNAGSDCVQRCVRALLTIGDMVESGSAADVSAPDLKTIASIARTLAASVKHSEVTTNQPTIGAEVLSDGV